MGTHRKPAIPGSGQNDQFDFDALLHPAGAFASPADVACDTDLTLNEKRAILAAWASDAREGEAAPALRSTPGAGRTVALDDAMDALRALGWQSGTFRPPSHYRNVLENRIPGVFGRKSRGAGEGPQIN